VFDASTFPIVLKVGAHHYECTRCQARVLVTFSDAPPVTRRDDRDGGTERVVTIADTVVHRCVADTTEWSGE